jgi:hypothetical protein
MNKEFKECEFDCVEGGYCNLGYVKLIPEFENLCKDNPNCYYKQLLQSQQDLKVAVDLLNKINDKYYQDAWGFLYCDVDKALAKLRKDNN